MIEVRELRKSYGKVQALNGVSFSVAEGTIYGLLGPNGAGKSTTISILAGLVKPSSGSALIAGHDVEADGAAAKRALGFVPQEIVLYEELNARENLEFFGGLYGLRGTALRDSVDELLSAINLEENAKRPVETYSGGMKRRVNLACGLVHRPRVLLLDEPTVGIDPQARVYILDMVRRIAERGTTILYTTHYMHEAEELCHKIAIIDQGRILAEGTLEELRARVGERDLVTVRGQRFDPAAVERLMEQVQGAEVLQAREDELVFAMHQGSESVGRLMRSLDTIGEAREVHIRQPSLENLFIKLTGRDLRE